MLSAFTARPIVELKQRDKSKIESILAYGMRLGATSGAKANSNRRQSTCGTEHWSAAHLPRQ
jgi:hypothetical protein